MFHSLRMALEALDALHKYVGPRFRLARKGSAWHIIENPV